MGLFFLLLFSSFSWYSSFLQSLKNEAKKLFASIARLQRMASHNPAEATG
jgi:hypothetical protein